MSKDKLVESLHQRHSNPGVFWFIVIILLVAMGVSVSYLGGETELANISPKPTRDIRQPRFYTVSYKGGVFSPTNLRIHAGDTVRFKNESFFGIRVITDNNQLPGFDSVGDVPQGSYFSFTFAETGIFGYHNEKKSEEQGTIIVR